MSTDAAASDAKQLEIFALEAKLSIARGDKIAPEQRKAADRYDRELIDSYLTACPRGQYSTLVGKQIKQLGDIHATYGVPIEAGDDVNLIDVLRWFHEWLAKWGPRVKKNQLADEDAIAADREREKLELRRMQAQIAKIEADVERRRAESISIEEVRKTLAWLSAELRKLGERLGKRFGEDAQVAMNETLLRIEQSLAEEVGK